MRTGSEAAPFPPHPTFRLPRLGTLLRGLVLTVTLVFLVRMVRSGWSDIIGAALHLATRKVWYLVLAIALEVAWTWSLAQVYRRALLAVGGHAGNLSALRVSMGAFTLSRVLPGGGAVGGLFAAREFITLGNSGPLTITSMVIGWWISMTSLGGIVLGGVGTGVVLGALPASYLVPPALIVGGLIGLGAAAVLATRGRRLRHRVLRSFDAVLRKAGIRSSRHAAEEALDVTLSSLGGGRPLLPVFMWASTSWVLDACALWIVFAAFGHRLGVGALLVGYGLANLLQALPEVTPGWLGVLETTLSVTYAAFGVPAGVAVVAVLSYRLISFWLPVAAGVPFGIRILSRHQVGRPDLQEAAA